MTEMIVDPRIDADSAAHIRATIDPETMGLMPFMASLTSEVKRAGPDHALYVHSGTVGFKLPVFVPEHRVLDLIVRIHGPVPQGFRRSLPKLEQIGPAPFFQTWSYEIVDEEMLPNTPMENR